MTEIPSSATRNFFVSAESFSAGADPFMAGPMGWGWGGGQPALQSVSQTSKPLLSNVGLAVDWLDLGRGWLTG